MRIAIVSDIHGNLTALQAVIAGLRDASPDLILQGGDLADSGSSPAEVVDLVRELGWPGVIGNGEEALTQPATLNAFARSSKAPPHLWDAVRQLMDAARQRLGDQRLAWLASQPRAHLLESLAFFHASPNDAWRAPAATAADPDLLHAYGECGRPVVLYGHIHHGFVRRIGDLIVANCGSAGMPYDGDSRASYAIIEAGQVSLRRVAYDVDYEIRRLAASGMPHAGWIARILRAASPSLP